jgi:hypothetical protein
LYVKRFDPRGPQKRCENVCTGPVLKQDVWPTPALGKRLTRTNIREVDPYKLLLISGPDFCPEMFVRVSLSGPFSGECLYGSASPPQGLPVQTFFGPRNTFGPGCLYG